jgi:hypothetical protein
MPSKVSLTSSPHPVRVVGPAKAERHHLKLNAEVTGRCGSPTSGAAQAKGIHTEPFTPEEFTAFFKREIDRWAPLARASSMQGTR